MVNCNFCKLQADCPGLPFCVHDTSDLEAKLAEAEARVERRNEVIAGMQKERNKHNVKQAERGRLLAASQAREKQMREKFELLQRYLSPKHVTEHAVVEEALALPTDDTALREYVAALLDDLTGEISLKTGDLDAMSVISDRVEQIRSGK